MSSPVLRRHEPSVQHSDDERPGAADRPPSIPKRGSQIRNKDHGDVVFTFSTSWRAAAARGFSYPEDRLAITLLGNDRVRHALICDPFVSGPRAAARALLGRSDPRFPADATAAHYRPHGLRRLDPTSVRALQRRYAAYERGIRSAAAHHGLVRPAIVTANPLFAAFSDLRWAGPVTYYGWDDWASFEGRRRWWPAYDEAFRHLREKRRRVVAVSAEIAQRIGPTGRCAVIPNGLDPTEWLELPSPPAWLMARPAPRLVYVGSLESRLDVDQIRSLAAAFPGGSINLVGSLIEPAHFAPLQEIANVHFQPRVSREQVPGVIAGADLGLIPHVRTRFTEAISRPLKLYEYLAAGKPVVATVTSPGIHGLSERVLTVLPDGDMVPAARRALALEPQPEAARREFIAEHAWARRFDTLLELALAAD